MLIALREGADAALVRQQLTGLGLWSSELFDQDRVVRLIAISPASAPVEADRLLEIPGVEEVLSPTASHPLVDQHRGEQEIAGVPFDGEVPVLIAGPCAIDNEEMVHGIARQVAAAGARILRGGAFKPRTSPYAFSGHGESALGWMRAAADAHQLAMVTEVMSEGDVEAVASVADILQVGSRNMQNYALLHAVGGTGRPVLLKRGMGATIDEWLMAGEHLYSAGAPAVIFCERGIRGFDIQTRNLLDLAGIAVMRHQYGVTVIADPSHGTGRRDLVVPLSHAAVCAGAHGIMVEVNPSPGNALSDGPQAISPARLEILSQRLGLPGA